MKLSKKITATAAATALASAALLTPAANAQTEDSSARDIFGGTTQTLEPQEGAPEVWRAPERDLLGSLERPQLQGSSDRPTETITPQPGTPEDLIPQTLSPEESEKQRANRIAARVGGTILGLGVLGAVLGNVNAAHQQAEEAPKDDEKKPEAKGEAAPKEEAPKGEQAGAKEEAPKGEAAPKAEAPAAPAAEAAPEAAAPAGAAAPAADAAAPAQRNVQLANTGVKPEISILAGLALIALVSGAWLVASRRQA